MFLRNTWYLAGWSDELTAGSKLARTVAGEPIVFFRDSRNVVAALLDMCPHRFAPLSRGTVRSDGIHCGYHGLAFGANGACVANPHGPVVSALKVRTFPVVERHDAVWIWMGDRERADVGAIPDLSFIDAVPAPSRVKGYLHTRANYQLMVDNIMDLSHADYLHPDTLGGGINTRTKGKVEERDDCVAIRWHASNEILPPVMASQLPDPTTRGDFQNEVYWFAPGIMKQRLRFAPAGRLSEEGQDSWTAHVMIPATERDTHYFFCHTSDAVTRDPSIAATIKQILLSAFEGEDAPMIEAQQERIGARNFFDLMPVLLSTDSGAVRARRALDKLIAAERQQSD